LQVCCLIGEVCLELFLDQTFQKARFRGQDVPFILGKMVVDPGSNGLKMLRKRYHGSSNAKPDSAGRPISAERMFPEQGS
jgi:hypothetical protein